MKNNTIGTIIGIALTTVLFTGLFIKEYNMKDHSTTCARFVKVFRGKSSYYFVFEYKVGDTTVQGVRVGRSLKIKNIDRLKKMDCIEIAYSKSDPTNMRITDNQVGNEWIWWNR